MNPVTGSSSRSDVSERVALLDTELSGGGSTDDEPACGRGHDHAFCECDETTDGEHRCRHDRFLDDFEIVGVLRPCPLPSDEADGNGNQCDHGHGGDRLAEVRGPDVGARHADRGGRTANSDRRASMPVASW